ncbi:MAG TPA: hypothetical protein VFL97_01415 [Nitrococcus sp.]|nr:hypothetical protein [Nitrococcus sp.]
MKTWREAMRDSIAPGTAAGLTTLATVAARGSKDTGSAVAPINASSHAIWGDKAASVEAITVRHTVPGVIFNVAGTSWWALVFEKLFGTAVDRRGFPAALLGGTATAALAYLVDYRIVPRRLTPGWEHRVSRSSLFMTLGAMAAGLTIGAMCSRRNRC